MLVAEIDVRSSPPTSSIHQRPVNEGAWQSSLHFLFAITVVTTWECRPGHQKAAVASSVFSLLRGGQAIDFVLRNELRSFDPAFSDVY
jgi:hypothetical protein